MPASCSEGMGRHQEEEFIFNLFKWNTHSLLPSVDLSTHHVGQGLYITEPCSYFLLRIGMGEKQQSKHWVLCLHVKEKAEGRNCYIIAISGKCNHFKAWQIPGDPMILLVNHDSGMGTRVRKLQGKGSIQIKKKKKNYGDVK